MDKLAEVYNSRKRDICFLPSQAREWIFISFWPDEWPAQGTLREEFLKLFALVQSLQALVRDCWDKLGIPFVGHFVRPKGEGVYEDATFINAFSTCK